jgi:hypothetical protein
MSKIRSWSERGRYGLENPPLNWHDRPWQLIQSGQRVRVKQEGEAQHCHCQGWAQLRMPEMFRVQGRLRQRLLDSPRYWVRERGTRLCALFNPKLNIFLYHSSHNFHRRPNFDHWRVARLETKHEKPVFYIFLWVIPGSWSAFKLRMQIQQLKLMWIHADPHTQPWHKLSWNMICYKFGPVPNHNSRCESSLYHRNPPLNTLR